MVRQLLFLCGLFTCFPGIFGSVVPINDSSPVELTIVVPVLDKVNTCGEEYNLASMFILGLFKAAVVYSLEKCNNRLEPHGLQLTQIFVNNNFDSTTIEECPEGMKRGLLDLVREYHGICGFSPLQERNASVIAFLSNILDDIYNPDIAKIIEVNSDYFCAPLLTAMDLENDLVHSTDVLEQMMQELRGVTFYSRILGKGIGSFNSLNNPYIVPCETNCTARPCIVTVGPETHFSGRSEPAAVYIFSDLGFYGWETLVSMAPYIEKKQLGRQTQAVVILSHGVVDIPYFFTYSNRSNWEIDISIPELETIDKILKTMKVLAIQATNPDKSVPRYLQNLRYGDLIGKDDLRELKQFMELKCNEAEGSWSNYTSCPLNYTLPEAYNTQIFNATGIVPLRTNVICDSLGDLLAEKCKEGARGVCDEFWEGFIAKEHGTSKYIDRLNGKEYKLLGSGIHYLIYHLNTTSYTWRVAGQADVTVPVFSPQIAITWFDKELIARLRQIIDTNPFNCKDNQHQTCKNYERMVSNQTCCFTCIPCDPFSYPDSESMEGCRNCPDGQVFSRNTSACVRGITPMIDWTKPGDFGITCFIIIVLVISLACLVLSIYKRSSPILKMALPVHFFGIISLAVVSCICGLITIGGFAFESGGLGGYCVFLWFFVCVTIVANAIFLLTKLQTYGPLVDFCIGGTMQQLARRKLITASVLAAIQVIIMAGTATSFDGTSLIMLNKRIDSWGSDCLWITSLQDGTFLPSLLFPLVLQFCVVIRAGLFVRSHVSVKFINREILIILVCAVVQLAVGIAVLVLVYTDVPQLNNLTKGEGKMLVLLIYSVLNPAIGVLVLVVPQLAMMMCRCGFLHPSPASGHVTSDLLMNRLRA